MNSRHRSERVIVPDQPSPTGEALEAQAEQNQLESGRSAHLRDEVSRAILARGMWVLIVLVLLIIAGAVIALGWHLILPKSWHWLAEEELQDVKNFVLSGAVVSLGTAYVRRYLDQG